MEYVKIFFYIFLAIFVSSFDRWVGETLFFIFPIVIVYVLAFEKSEAQSLFFTFLYTILYFGTRFDLGLFAIMFFLILLVFNYILKNLRMSFIKVILYSATFSIFLSFITSSYYSFLIDIIIILILYFLNMRYVFYERE